MIVGIGTDVSDINRFARAISRRGDRLLHRVFTPDEISYCMTARHPAAHFAARFAAKEAVFKALGTGWGQGVRWTEVEVERGKRGQPTIRLSGAARKRAESLGTGRVWLSLSTEKEQALAFAILESIPKS
ncbi:MAG: holo-ACP synthase [Acidobacteria bacterium]|nr:holo-ACP synthase [Acidobacteriota bacterium]